MWRGQMDISAFEESRREKYIYIYKEIEFLCIYFGSRYVKNVKSTYTHLETRRMTVSSNRLIIKFPHNPIRVR